MSNSSSAAGGMCRTRRNRDWTDRMARRPRKYSRDGRAPRFARARSSRWQRKRRLTDRLLVVVVTGEAKTNRGRPGDFRVLVVTYRRVNGLKKKTPIITRWMVRKSRGRGHVRPTSDREKSETRRTTHGDSSSGIIDGKTLSFARF